MQLLQLYHDLLFYQRRLCKLIGCDFWENNFKVINGMTIFVITNAAFYYIVNTYSMFKFSNEGCMTSQHTKSQHTTSQHRLLNTRLLNTGLSQHTTFQHSVISTHGFSTNNFFVAFKICKLN